MDYFIQGDAANADKIKAAFKKKGFIKEDHRDIDENNVLFFTVDGDKNVHYCWLDQPYSNIIKTHPDYQELELPVEPKFKVGSWIVQNDNGTVSQITKVIKDIDEDGEYRAYEHTNGYFHEVFENEYHLWSIADAKNGDILSAKIDGDDYILIFKQIKDGWIETYGHYYITIDKFCAPTQMFCRNYQGTLYPATQEQYKTLFKKMHDDGYEWDFDKKGLKKIPANPKFKVGDWLAANEPNNYARFIHIEGIEDSSYLISQIGGAFGSVDRPCITFVEEYYHPFSINDAKDGDVLYFNDNTIVIFKDLYNSTTFHSYCHIEDDLFEISEDEMPDWWESKGFTPATKEQRDLLFAKMKEVGYQWDADKKELRKIKPHYDISNFKPRQWVLVRDCDNQVWGLSMFSHRDMGCYICLNREDFTQCIPFKGNEKLLGTTDMCGKEFINW